MNDKLDAHASKTFTITFRYVGSNTSNPELNSFISFDFEKYYTITYHLDGGTNPNNQPDTYLNGSSTPIYAATKTNFTFDGWYDNSGFLGNQITSTSGKTGNLNLYAKWISNSSDEIATTYIANLVGNASDSSTNVITLTAPTGASCTNTLAYDGTSNKNLRYVGADPCNYVKFNCDSSGNNCEIWRIMGVMKNIDTNPVLKLVKYDTSLSAQWHSSNSNNWNSANLNTNLLNSTFLNSLNSGVVSDYLLSVQWLIGAVAYNTTASNAYTSEKGTSSNAAYIGIMSVSDFFFATSGTNDTTRATCLSTAMNNVNDLCYQNNYLMFYDSNSQRQNQWTLTKNNSGNSVLYISNGGKAVKGNAKSQNPYYYMPTVYLKSNVKIKTDVGDGSSTSPYELVKGS